MSTERSDLNTAGMHGNLEALAANPYPGRGIVLGVSMDGDQAVQAYWVMGRSDNSRNRVLAEVDGVVRTEPFDVSKVEDPSLIIYNALVKARQHNGPHIVSNGDQTDTVHERLLDAALRGDRDVHKSFRNALLDREYEPDDPNYTPRITGMISPDGIYDYSIIRRNPYIGQPEHTFGTGSLSNLTEGTGICFHTYEGDGDPLPAFEGGPYVVPLGNDADEVAEEFWEHLNKENRVAVVAKTINRVTGEIVCRIINQHNPELDEAIDAFNSGDIKSEIDSATGYDPELEV